LKKAARESARRYVNGRIKFAEFAKVFAPATPRVLLGSVTLPPADEVPFYLLRVIDDAGRFDAPVFGFGPPLR
jgi:hypothetical protein